MKNFAKRLANALQELERDRHIAGRFSRLFPAKRGITASSFTVVFGIIENWKAKTLAQRLPFFSKVNLRRCVHDLSRMGYEVAYKRIQINGNA